MSSNSQATTSGEESHDADLAEAFKDIARGERTAAALENQLSSIEKRIDELLARADQDQKELEKQAERQSTSTSSEEPGNDDSKSSGTEADKSCTK